MARGINKMTLIGNLGQDPELRFRPDGGAVCVLSVATTETWKDRQTGERKEHTEWHRCVLFDRQAEIAGEYLKKGSTVYLEGKLRTNKWEDKEGQTRWTTEIRCHEMHLMGGRKDAGHKGNETSGAESASDGAAASAADFDDDLSY